MNLNELQKKIETYDNELNESEKKKANVEGKQESLFENLKIKFQLNSIDEIDNELEKSIVEREKLEKEINSNLIELEKYDME